MANGKHTVKYLGLNDANDPMWSVQWPTGGNRFCFLKEKEAYISCEHLNMLALLGKEPQIDCERTNILAFLGKAD